MRDARTSGTATERLFSLKWLVGDKGSLITKQQLHKNVHQMYTKAELAGMRVEKALAVRRFLPPDALDYQNTRPTRLHQLSEEGVYGW